jgi:uncharacterized damage-inducible protein DinB
MALTEKPEVWLRGPLPGIPALLQPVAHALLQAREELREAMGNFPASHLWESPGGVAAVGFHLQHLSGVLDRLFTYARGEKLSPDQLEALGREGRSSGEPEESAVLLRNFNQRVDTCLEQLSRTDPATLTEVREVGRARVPATHLGLLFHAAEHTMRHLGQLLVTVRVTGN